MNNQVSFKRGSESKIKQLKEFDSGSFYLSIDTEKLFYAKSEQELIELNNNIIIVNKPDEVPQQSSNIQVGKLIYIKDTKKFYICEDKINNNLIWVDITNTDFQFVIKKISSAASQNQLYQYIFKANDKEIVGTFEIPLQDIIQQLDFHLVKNEDSIQLITPNPQANINLYAGEGITFTQNPKGIEVSAPQDKIQSISTLPFGGLQINNNSYSVDGNSLLYVNFYDEQGNRTPIYNQDNIDWIYTKSEVDKKLSNFNAIKYCGTVGTTEQPDLPAFGIKNGDMYKVAALGSYGPDHQVAMVGDIFIATGFETDKFISADLKWTYIPIQENADTQYKITFTEGKNPNLQILNLSTGDIESIPIVGENINVEYKNSQLVFSQPNLVLPSGAYGDSLPSTGIPGQIFFLRRK